MFISICHRTRKVVFIMKPFFFFPYCILLSVLGATNPITPERGGSQSQRQNTVATVILVVQHCDWSRPISGYSTGEQKIEMEHHQQVRLGSPGKQTVSTRNVYLQAAIQFKFKSRIGGVKDKLRKRKLRTSRAHCSAPFNECLTSMKRLWDCSHQMKFHVHYRDELRWMKEVIIHLGT